MQIVLFSLKTENIRPVILANRTTLNSYVSEALLKELHYDSKLGRLPASSEEDKIGCAKKKHLTP